MLLLCCYLFFSCFATSLETFSSSVSSGIGVGSCFAMTAFTSGRSWISLLSSSQTIPFELQPDISIPAFLVLYVASLD